MKQEQQTETEEVITIRVDVLGRKMTLADWATLQSFRQMATEGNQPPDMVAKLIEMLDRVCRFEGVPNAGQIPIHMIGDVAEQILASLPSLPIDRPTKKWGGRLGRKSRRK